MKIDGIIYTTTNSKWIPTALQVIYRVMALAKGIEVGTLEVKKVTLPEDFKTRVKGLAVRPDFDWFVTKYPQKGVVRALHITRAEHDKLGLRHSFGGRLGGIYNRNIGDTSLEFVFIADTIDKFIEKFLHECLHGLFHWSGQDDKTHAFGNSRLEEAYSTVDFTRWNLLKTLKNLLESLVAAHKARLTDSVETEPKLPLANALQPKVQRAVDAVLSEMKRLGHEVRLVQGFRSIEEQDFLYEQGRTRAGAVVTNARGGESFHNYGIAADFVFKKQGYDASEMLWQLLGLVGKKQGFEWGGDWTGFVDRPHLEMPLNYKLSNFQNDKIDWSKYK